jgi:hypothetical protein
VRRLMAAMGMEAIYRRPNLSKAAKKHPIYPYLRRELAVTRPNQIRATDITYIPVAGGFVSLCAVIDWHSRYAPAWELSNTRYAAFCVCAVDGPSNCTACRRSLTPTKAANIQARPEVPPVLWRGSAADPKRNPTPCHRPNQPTPRSSNAR